MGLSHEVPGEFPAEPDTADFEFLEFLGSLEDDDAQWQEFFSGVSDQLDAEEDADEE